MVTVQEFQAFADFAIPLIHSGQAGSLSELIQHWEAQRDEEETLASIRRGIADVNAGRVKPVDEVIAKIRKELGLT